MRCFTSYDAQSCRCAFFLYDSMPSRLCDAASGINIIRNSSRSCSVAHHSELKRKPETSKLYPKVYLVTKIWYWLRFPWFSKDRWMFFKLCIMLYQYWPRPKGGATIGAWGVVMHLPLFQILVFLLYWPPTFQKIDPPTFKLLVPPLPGPIFGPGKGNHSHSDF